MLLGSVALQRSSEAENASAPEAEVHRHLESALQFYRQALNLFPDDAVGDLAVVYNQLGKIHEVRREWEPALTYYRRSIHCEEKQDHQHGAGLTRRNVADVLAKQRRFADAKEYALTASQDFEACGEGAKEDLLETLKLMAKVMELQGDICGAGQTHSKVARLLAESARFADAKEYALAALRGFEACGQGKEQEVALKLYMEIDKGLQAQGSGARNQKRE